MPTLFDSEDTPLFSGTPQRVQTQAPPPATETRQQLGFFECAVCRDTGWVMVEPGEPAKRCWCQDVNSDE